MFIVGILKYGTSIIPLDEFPITNNDSLNFLKYPVTPNELTNEKFVLLLVNFFMKFICFLVPLSCPGEVIITLKLNLLSSLIIFEKFLFQLKLFFKVSG